MASEALHNRSSSAPEPLHVLVIGGGLCGLAVAIAASLSGCRVTVFESVASIHEIGAGLQSTPNGTRLLRQWGIFELLEPLAAKPVELQIRRFDGRLLARRTEYDLEVNKYYNSSLWGLHRVDLQHALVKRAQQLGVVIKYSARVSQVDFDEPAIILEGGDCVSGDLVVAADGLWSTSRSQLLGKPMAPQPTGHMAYRILLSRDDIEDADLRMWMSTPKVHIWLGPGAHCVGYPIHGGKLLNLVLLVKDDLPGNISRAKGDLAEMKALFHDWDPILARFLAKVERVDKWRLMHLIPLDTWRSQSGKFVMAGDACHAILPYMAQGFNLALEDAATLGSLLSRVNSSKQLPMATAIYEMIRRERTRRMHEETFKHGREFHLPDGLEQQLRDKELAASFEHSDGCRDRWTHPKIQSWIWGYDAYAEVEKAFAEHPF